MTLNSKKFQELERIFTKQNTTFLTAEATTVILPAISSRPIILYAVFVQNFCSNHEGNQNFDLFLLLCEVYFPLFFFSFNNRIYHIFALSIYSRIKTGKTHGTKVSTAVYVNRRFAATCCIEQHCWIPHSILHRWQTERKHMPALISDCIRARPCYTFSISGNQTVKEIGK